MKKILTILLIVCILPIVVNADMGAPIIQPYEAYVVNANGADYYEYYYENDENGYKKKGTLTYDTKIKVEYEESIDGKTYAQFEKDDNWYYILTKDIIPINDEFIIDEKNEEDYVYKLDEKAKVTVLKEDGIKMHKGPANAYSTIGSTIPKKTNLEYEFAIGEEGIVWAYVEYKGTKGWISFLDGTVGSYIEGNMLIAKDLEITYEGNVIGTIPANTILSNYYSIDPWSWGYYITYDGVSGYIEKYYATISYGTSKITSKNNKVLYESADLNSKVIVDNIPENTPLKFSYSVGSHWDEWIYTTYNGKTGWVYYSDEEANSDDITYERISDETIEPTKKVTTKTTSPNEIVLQNNSLTGEQIIILCLGLAIIASITAIIIVALINKKKTNVENNQGH